MGSLTRSGTRQEFRRFWRTEVLTTSATFLKPKESDPKKNSQQRSFCWPFWFQIGLSKINDVF